jgi:hypothetical protein
MAFDGRKKGGAKIQALTSSTFKSPLTIFFRPERIGGDRENFGLLFHEALHGFGAWTGAGDSYSDRSLKVTLGLPLRLPSEEISILIRSNCYRRRQ